MVKVLRIAAIGGAMVTTALLVPGAVASAGSDESDETPGR